MPTYFACQWRHDDDNEPVMLYEELDDDRYELRIVEEFGDGRLVRTDRIDLAHDTTMTWVQIPTVEEIDADPDLIVQPLAADEFEAKWVMAEDAR